MKYLFVILFSVLVLAIIILAGLYYSSPINPIKKPILLNNTYSDSLNISSCYTLVDNASRDICLARVASGQKNYSICHLINSKITASDCARMIMAE